MAQNFKEFYFTLYFIHFQFATNHSTVFAQTPKSKFNSPVLISLKSFVRRKPIPVFDPRPLYCSSLTTTVGGTKDTNFVDFGSPYRGTNQLLRNSPKQSWVRLRDELLDNFPRQFFRKSSLKLLSQPFSFFFHFLSCHALIPTI